MEETIAKWMYTRNGASKHPGDEIIQTHTSFHPVTRTLHIEEINIQYLRDQLFELMTKDENKDEDVYSWNALSEKINKDKPFRLFFDLDWNIDVIQDVEDPQKLIQNVVIRIKELVNEILGFSTECIIACRLFYKLHLHFPQITVNSIQATNIIQLIDKKLREEYPKLRPTGVLDKSVYNTGIRMIWCHKGSIGKKAKYTKDKERHISIYGKNNVHYSDLYYVVDSNFNRLPLEKWHLRDTSIRVPESEQIVSIPNISSTVSIRKRKVEKNDNLLITHSSSASQVQGQIQGNEEIEEENVQQDTLDLLAEQMESLYEFVGERYRVQKNMIGIPIRKGNSIIVPIETNFCPFKNDIHTGNVRQRVVINLQGASQRCYSTKSDKCINGKYNEVKFTLFPASIKEIVISLSRDEQVSQNEILQQIVPFRESPPPYGEIDWSLGEARRCVHWGILIPLDRNLACPICKLMHDKAENFISINEHGTVVIGCRVNFGTFWPDPPTAITNQQVNILYQNNITVNNVNNIYSDDITLDVQFNEVFPIFEDVELNMLMFKSFNGFTANMGKVVHYLGKNRFGVSQTSEMKDIWWAWDIIYNKWLMATYKAEIFLIDEVSEYYLQAKQYFTANTKNEELRKRREIRFDQILKRIMDRDQTSLLHLAAVRFKEDGDFEAKLNAKKNLIGFCNGVYDLDEGLFHSPRSSDYVTFSTGYNLPSDVDKNIRNSIMQFIYSIMPNEQMVDYLLRFLASCLDGYNREEIFTIFTGSGRNGKGALCELIKYATGDYYHTVQPSMLTMERPSSSSPCPDLLNIKGKRILMTSEPEKNSTINGGFLKYITGNDTIAGRYCHKNTEVHFSPQHSLIIQCNKVPKLDSKDQAIWDRSRIIDFPFKFTDDPQKPNDKKIDRTLKDKIKHWGPQFMLLLLEKYKDYKNIGLTPVAEVLNTTQSIREQNIPYMDYVEFLQRNYETTNDKNVFIYSSDIIEHFCRLHNVSEVIAKYQLYPAAVQLGYNVNNHCGRGKSRDGKQNHGKRGYVGLVKLNDE